MESLFDAASSGDLKTVQRLMLIVSDINAQREKDGSTCLILASQGGHLDTVQALVSAGADTDILRHDGRAAVDIASEMQSAEAAQSTKDDENNKYELIVRMLRDATLKD